MSIHDSCAHACGKIVAWHTTQASTMNTMWMRDGMLTYLCIIGLQNTTVIASQELAAERAEREMLEILDSFDETHHLPHLGMRAPTAPLHSGDASGSDPLGLSLGSDGRKKGSDGRKKGKKGQKIADIFSEADVGAGIEFAKAVALGDVEQMLALLEHGYVYIVSILKPFQPSCACYNSLSTRPSSEL